MELRLTAVRGKQIIGLGVGLLSGASPLVVMGGAIHTLKYEGVLSGTAARPSGYQGAR